MSSNRRTASAFFERQMADRPEAVAVSRFIEAMLTLADRVTQFRKVSRLSRRTLAGHCGVPVEIVQLIESGEAGIERPLNLKTIRQVRKVVDHMIAHHEDQMRKARQARKDLGTLVKVSRCLPDTGKGDLSRSALALAS